MMLPENYQAALYFDQNAVAGGTLYSLVSGHFIHSDINHWLWNCLAMLILGTIIEITSKRLLLCSLVSGIIAVDILLLSPLNQLNYYCGLSGVLNTLLMVALWIVWQQQRSKWVGISALLCIGKIIIEMNTQQSLLVHISWPPYPAAHMAGAISGAMLIFLTLLVTYNTASRGSKLNDKTFNRFSRLT